MEFVLQHQYVLIMPARLLSLTDIAFQGPSEILANIAKQIYLNDTENVSKQIMQALLVRPIRFVFVEFGNSAVTLLVFIGLVIERFYFSCGTK